MKYIAVIVLCTLWAASIVCAGIPGIFGTLGGSAGIFIILPLLFIKTLGYRGYERIVWSIIFTSLGLILINYLYSIFLNKEITIKGILGAYIVYLPLIFIGAGIITTLFSFLVAHVDIVNDETERDCKIIHNIGGFSLITLAGIPLFSILFMLLISDLGWNHIYSTSYVVGLFLLIAGEIIFLAKIMNISIQTLNHFARPIPRGSLNIMRKRNRLWIYVVVILLYSTMLELRYRGNVIIWTETAIILSGYATIIFRLSQILLMPLEIKGEQGGACN